MFLLICLVFTLCCPMIQTIMQISELGVTAHAEDEQLGSIDMTGHRFLFPFLSCFFPPSIPFPLVVNPLPLFSFMTQEVMALKQAAAARMTLLWVPSVALAAAVVAEATAVAQAVLAMVRRRHTAQHRLLGIMARLHHITLRSPTHTRVMQGRPCHTSNYFAAECFFSPRPFPPFGV